MLYIEMKLRIHIKYRVKQLLQGSSFSSANLFSLYTLAPLYKTFHCKTILGIRWFKGRTLEVLYLNKNI